MDDEGNIINRVKGPASKGFHRVAWDLVGGDSDRDRSPSGQAGLRGGDREQAVKSGNSIIYLGGDVIIAIGDSPITTLSDFYGALEDSRPGDTVPVTIMRGNDRKVVNVELSERRQSY